MSDFAAAWQLSRQRLLETIGDLNHDQLNWRIHSDSLTIAEMTLHVAGVEIFFTAQLLGLQLDEYGAKLKTTSTEGVVNDNPFPYTADELSPEAVAKALDYSKGYLEPLISNPSEEVLEKELVSALGPVITGYGAFTRLAFHSAYHQGQAYLIRTAPGFPK